ncbi:MAG: hypothetical protein ACKVS7_05365 [Gemmatimonadaceae bacterium]
MLWGININRGHSRTARAQFIGNRAPNTVCCARDDRYGVGANPHQRS